MSDHHDIHFTLPALWILLPLMAGISLHAMPWQAALVMAVLAVGLTVCHFVYAHNSVSARWLMPLALCFGMIAAGHALYNAQADATRWQGAGGICRITITGRPVERANSWEYDADAGGQRVKIYIASDSTLMPGTALWIRTRWQPTHEKARGETFDYMHYLFLQGYSATAYVPAYGYSVSAETGMLNLMQRLRLTAGEARDRVIGIYRRSGITGDALAVLSALTLGSREELSPDIRQAYVRAGAMHVLAVSGLHVGIICLILMRLLWLFGYSRAGRAIRAALMIVALTGYAFITGLTPSVVRAAMMFGIILTARLLQIKHSLLNTLCFTAFLTLLIDPMALYSVSFQLSYCATAAIVSAMPWLRQHEPSRRIRTLYYAIAVTLAAQLGATPLLLYHFHQFSTVFFAAALLVVPFAEVVIYGAAALLLTQFSTVLSSIVATLLQWLLNLQNWVVKIIQSPSWSSVEVWISLPQCIALFCVSVCLIVLLYARNKWRATLLTFTAVAAFLLFTAVSITGRSGERVVIGQRGEMVAHIVGGGQMTVCCSDSAKAYAEAHELDVKYRITRTNWNECQNTAFVSGGKKWVVAQDTLLRYMKRRAKKSEYTEDSELSEYSAYSDNSPLAVNHLVIGRAAGRSKPEKLLAIYRPDTLHLLASYPQYRIATLDSLAQKQGIAIKKH